MSTTPTDWNAVFSSDSFRNLPMPEKSKFLVSYVPGFADLNPKERFNFLQTYVPEFSPPPEAASKGFWSAVGEDVVGAVKGIGEMAVHPYAEVVRGYKEGGVKEAAVRGGLAAAFPLGDPVKSGMEIAAGEKRERDAGFSVPYRAAAAVGRATGVIDPTAMEQSKSVGEVVGHAVVPTLTAASPLIGEGLGKVAGKLRPMNALQGGARAAGVEDVFRASVPGAGAKDINLRANVEAAANDLAEIQRKTPLEGAGGIANPDKRLRNFAENVRDYKTELWRQEVEPQIQRWAKSQENMQPIKKAILDTITQTDREMNPSGVRAVERLVERMPDFDTLGNIAERRKTLNAYLRDFEKKGASDKSAAMQTKPLTEALKAADRATSDQMFKGLTKRGEPGIDAVERRYAALSDLESAARSQANDAEKFRLFDRLKFSLSPSHLFGVREHITAEPPGGRLMQRGLRRLESTGAAPKSGQSGPGSALPAPANRMLPAAGQSSPSGPLTVGSKAPGGPTTGRMVIIAPGETPTQALARSPGTTPKTTLPTSGRVMEPSPSTPPPEFPSGRKGLPPAPAVAGAPVAPYAQKSPIRQLEVLGGDIHSAASFPRETPTLARIVGTGAKRRLQVWNERTARWEDSPAPLSGRVE